MLYAIGVIMLIAGTILLLGFVGRGASEGAAGSRPEIAPPKTGPGGTPRAT